MRDQSRARKSRSLPSFPNRERAVRVKTKMKRQFPEHRPSPKQENVKNRFFLEEGCSGWPEKSCLHSFFLHSTHLFTATIDKEFVHKKLAWKAGDSSELRI